MMIPKVSIIINCHNGEKFLEETLSSIKEQTFVDYEIVFWDNMSEDNSKLIALSFGSKLKYFRSDDFTTLGEARNNAIMKAKGEYIAFVDCDDVWNKEKLEKQVSILDSNPGCGMVFTNFIIYNMMKDTRQVFDKKAKDEILSFSQLVGNYSFCLSSFMLRKSALSNLDHYFNNKFKYAEEFELFSRISYFWKTAYIGEPLVTYRIHGEMNTIKLQDRIFVEYDLALNNLKKLDAELEQKYPQTVKKIEFIRDLNKVKFIIRDGNNKEVRKLMKPYLTYNFRAICFYVAALLPSGTTKKIVNMFYRKRI